MKLANKKIIIGILSANILLILFAVCGKILTRFVYEDHLDDTVITVDGENITLREFGYYIYKIEDFVQNQALLYDRENPKLWWNTHFSAGLDSQFVCDYAKKVAINTCICDQIYCMEAQERGLRLNDAAQAQTLSESKELFMKMTSLQLKATGLNEETIKKMNKRHTIASKYAESLYVTQDFSRYSGEPKDLLNWDGEYYQEVILPNHTVKLNDNILDKIVLGKITVNNGG